MPDKNVVDGHRSVPVPSFARTWIGILLYKDISKEVLPSSLKMFFRHHKLTTIYDVTDYLQLCLIGEEPGLNSRLPKK